MVKYASVRVRSAAGRLLMAPDLIPEAVTEAEEETERFGHRGEVVRTGNNKNPLVTWILKQEVLEVKLPLPWWNGSLHTCNLWRASSV